VFKKINFKSILVGIIIGVVLSIPVMANVTEYIFTQSNCKLFVDNVEYSNPDIPITLFMRNDSNFTPLSVVRDICTKLNIPFEYNNTTKEIRITTTGIIPTTTNTIGKEGTALMSETVGTTTLETKKLEKVTYRKGENDLIISTQFGIDYISMFSIESDVIRKHEDIFNKYLIEYNNEINTCSIKHINLNNQVTKEELDKDIVLSKDNKSTVILENIPIYYIQNTTSLVKNNTPLVKYDYYLNTIKPLFNQESSN
jgi:hypothetical protein